LKEVIILYDAKYMSDNLQNKNCKISVRFFSLQENPVLIVPWMVFTIFYLAANTILYIVFAAIYFEAILVVMGVGFTIAALINVCK
jgi:hypothetical protein